MGNWFSQEEILEEEQLIEQTRGESIVIRIEIESDEYVMITNYIETSSVPSHRINFEIRRVYKINRTSDPQFDEKKFNGFRPKEEHRMLLWHGTKSKNVVSIINNGFKVNFGENGANMFGKGVYFADRSTKSLRYSKSNAYQNVGYIFLCDVKLGRVKKPRNPHRSYKSPPEGFDSIKGTGKFRPDWDKNDQYLGAIVPSGATIPDTRFSDYNLLYNEYVVYDPKRINIRFLIEIRFH